MDEPKKPIVFVVDDSLTLRKMLQNVLQQMGFFIYELSCGEDVIELFKTVVPDAVLLDVEMPGIGGFETCERVRALPDGKDVPIMMVTGAEDVESINRAYRAGATDFTSKPLNWDIIGHRVLYMIRTGHNYLELQNTKQKLKQLNMDLEERVIERTSQLKAANRELEKTLNDLQMTQEQLVESERLAALGSLVAGVAHEINTPVGVVVTAISLMSQRTSSVEKLVAEGHLKRSDFVEYISGIKEVVQLSERNLETAIDLIKSFKQVSADQISEIRRQFNLKEYLEQIVLSVSPSVNNAKLSLSVDCPPDLLVDSYPGILSRVITIFIINSIEHGYEPGQSGELKLKARMLDDKVEIQYSDNGKGISEGNIKKIFDPFFTTRRGEGNVGLGLNIAYNSVLKVLGGNLKCTSQLGEGVVFTLSFPTLPVAGS